MAKALLNEESVIEESDIVDEVAVLSERVDMLKSVTKEASTRTSSPLSSQLRQSSLSREQRCTREHLRGRRRKGRDLTGFPRHDGCSLVKRNLCLSDDI